MITDRSRKVNRSQTALLVVDIQERLLPAIAEGNLVKENAIRLAKGMTLFQRPILVTEQYPKGLGSTVAELSSEIAGFSPIEKMTFSACTSELDSGLRKKNVGEVILCGIEAHVCVCQTCLDLVQHGFLVWVVADAISSRTLSNKNYALERMRDAGAHIVTTEMMLFELLQYAGTQEFKQVQSWIK